MRIGRNEKLGGMKPRLRVGQHVHQRLNPVHQGTVVQADKAGFTIAYDSHGRQPREPRMRQWFPASRADDFWPGTPAYDYVVVPPSDEP